MLTVGANLGKTLLRVATRFPDLELFALEPSPTNFRHLVSPAARRGRLDTFEGGRVYQTVFDGKTGF